MKMIVCKRCGHTAPEGEKCYQFQVDDVSKIDLNRIVREQYEAGNLVTLLTDGKEPKGLLIHNEFLERFSYHDNIPLKGCYLCPGYGDTGVEVIHRNGGFDAYGTRQGDTELTDAKFKILDRGQNLKALKAELAAARAFVRRIKVGVHSL